MKLATLKEGGRDGTLVVVSGDLQQAVKVPGIATTLQAALDDWENCESRLEEVYDALEAGRRDARGDRGRVAIGGEATVAAYRHHAPAGLAGEGPQCVARRTRAGHLPAGNTGPGRQ